MCQELLTNRRVTLNGIEYEAQRGVPQGGCASPLLWRIGCNNLATEMSKLKRVRETLFADDTALIVYGDTQAEFSRNVSMAIKIARDWCD